MLICRPDEEKVNQQGYYMGVPDLMVEILSESTRGKDCIKKMDLYLSTGVCEYWIINPFSREITVYLFDEKELVDNRSFQSGQNAASFIFDGLEIPVQSLFD